MAEHHDNAPLQARGAQRIADPRVWGATIGAVGATVFVLANRGALPAAVSGLALVAWGVALATYVWFVLVVVRAFPPTAAVRPRAGVVYLASVVGMLALIRLGSIVLDAADHAALRPALIVVAVGLHFLPFAAAFHTPMFRVLGWVMTAIGAVGLLLGWVVDELAASAAAVLAGVAMLVVIAADASRTATSSSGGRSKGR